MIIARKIKRWHLFVFYQVGGAPGVNSEAANTMMQKFWDSAMASSPIDDEEETRRLFSLV